MKRISRLLFFICAGFVFGGCMTSRSQCEIIYVDQGEVISSSAEVNTHKKYRIREVRMNDCFAAKDDSVMRNAVGSYAAMERIIHTCPGVFERNGEEIIVDILSFRKTADYQWTVVPCLLTVGICPYFQRDTTSITAEVSLISDSTKKARFSCQFIDDWKISFLFQLGSIPYSENALKKSWIGKRGIGDVSVDIRREGFANGIAKALLEIERGVK